MNFTPEQAKGMAMFFTTSLDTEFETTKKVLAAVPADKMDFKLGDNGRPASDLMWHMVTGEVWFGEGIANLNFGSGDPGPAPATPVEMLAYYESGYTAAIAKVKAMTGEQLATPVDFFGIMKLPVVLYIDFWAKHSIHHRGQLSSYLRAMNAHVPSIYGGSYDEPMVTGASA